MFALLQTSHKYSGTLTKSIEYLKSQQLSDGSWNNNAYETALALRVLFAVRLSEVAKVEISPANGMVGSLVTVNSAGFGAGELVRIDLGDSVSVAVTTASICGTFTTVFTVDTQHYDTHIISVTGITSGTYMVKLIKVGYYDWIGTVTVSAEATVDVTSTLTLITSSISVTPATITTLATFTLTISLYDGDGNPYSGPVGLANTTNSIIPLTVNLASGIWTGTATITKSPNGGLDTITAFYNKTWAIATATIMVFMGSQQGGTVTDKGVTIEFDPSALNNKCYRAYCYINPNFATTSRRNRVCRDSL
jgi:hypothetical protein